MAIGRDVRVSQIGLALLQKMAPQLHKRRTHLYLMKLLPPDDRPENTTGLRFQYFPAAISDSLSANYTTKQVPGGSHPLYQWVGGSERSLSFEVLFSTDVDPTITAGALFGSSPNSKSELKKAGHEDRNVDVRAAVLWLRSFMLPHYEASKRVYPPPKAILYLANSGIGSAGGLHTMGVPDAVPCVMADCSVEWTAFFPTGYPRLVKVSLKFNQICQQAGQVNFVGMGPRANSLIKTGWEIEGGYTLK